VKRVHTDLLEQPLRRHDPCEWKTCSFDPGFGEAGIKNANKQSAKRRKM